METGAASERPRRGLGVALGGGIVVLLAAGLAFEPRLADQPVPDFVARHYPLRIGSALGFGLPGAALLSTRSDHRLGRLMVAIGAAQAVSLFLDAYGTLGIHDPSAGLVAPGWMLPLAAAAWAPAFLAVPTLFLLLFPDGRLPSPRWRPVAALSVIALAVGVAGWMLLPPSANDVDVYPPGYDTPAPTWSGAATLVGISGLLAIVASAACVASLVTRYRRAKGAARSQLTWILVGGCLTVALLGTAVALGDAGPWVAGVGVMPLPASVAVAIGQHGLWDRDGVLRRTLVGAALGGGVLAVYLLVVAVAGTALGDRTGAPVVAAAAAAIAIGPAHRRVVRWANQLVYGDAEEPGEVLRQLGERLDAVGSGDVLADVCHAVARAVGAERVTVTVDDVLVAGWGAGGAVAEALPLHHRGERVGDLLVAGSIPLRPGHRSLLRELAPHVALVVQVGSLNTALVRSHDRLVAARDEERQRLERDLHDGVGPTLAALALDLDRGRLLLDRDVAAAHAVLDQLSIGLRDAVAAVRGLVTDLRPPPLDELGLDGALAALGRRFASAGMAIDVTADQHLPDLPADVELAAYRIASEAITNVVRHAGARCCKVSVRTTDTELALRVSDDGRGLDPDAPAGTGLRSMRERAELLGGAVEVHSGPAGTTVDARLPLAHQDALG